MPSVGIGRNLHLCFTKTKNQLPPLDDQSPSAELNQDDHIHIQYPILIENYNSTYHYHSSALEYYDSTTSKSPTHSSDDEAAVPDFAAVSASDRFFFSSPGRSNSIIESSPSVAASSESISDWHNVIVEGPHSEESNINNIIYPRSNQLGARRCDHQARQSFQSTVRDSVAVPTFSPDPYTDFRRSMQEMVKARDDLADVRANWDYLHELLLCYLALNPKSAHKFIVGAFADLLVSLLSTHAHEQADNGGRAGSDESAASGGGCEMSRRLM